MKLRNILITTLAASSLMMGLNSCDDSYLDEKMYSYFGADNMSDTNSKVLGLYFKVGQILGYSARQGYTGIWQDGTDVGAPGDIEGVEEPFYNYTALNSENGGVSYLWTQLYSIINSANIIIADQNANAKYLAEARFFRAWSYEQLATGWGGVPVLTEAIATPSTSFTRASLDEVNKVINEDLNFAIANLPGVNDYSKAEQSRINKDAARILAATSYLRQGKAADAEKVITPTITERNYTLINQRYGIHLADDGDYYSDMFRFGNQRRNQGNTEGIWTYEMEYGSDVPGGTIDAPQQRRNWVAAFHKLSGQMVNADSIGGRGNGRLRLSNYVKYGVFKEEGDIRNSNFNIRRKLYVNNPHALDGPLYDPRPKSEGGSEDKPLEVYVDEKGFKVDKNTPGAKAIIMHYGDEAVWTYGDTLNVMYPHPTKWGGYDPRDDFGWALVKDFPMMRFAEAYLLRAEAFIVQNKLSEAAADINELRNRAFAAYREQTGNVNAGKVEASQMTMDFLLDERIRELVGEENRRFTLMRTGKLAERVNMMVKQYPETTESKSIRGFDANKHCLLPIPLTEIQLNKDAELTQNPGY